MCKHVDSIYAVVSNTEHIGNSCHFPSESNVCSPFAHHLLTWWLLLAIQSPAKTTEVSRQTILYWRSPIQKAQIRFSLLVAQKSKPRLYSVFRFRCSRFLYFPVAPIFLHDGIGTFPYSSLFRISLDKTSTCRSAW